MMMHIILLPQCTELYKTYFEDEIIETVVCIKHILKIKLGYLINVRCMAIGGFLPQKSYKRLLSYKEYVSIW